MQIPCVYIPGPAPAVSVANKYGSNTMLSSPSRLNIHRTKAKLLSPKRLKSELTFSLSRDGKGELSSKGYSLVHLWAAAPPLHH